MAASYTEVLTRSVRAGGAITAKRMVGHDDQTASAGAAAKGVSLTDAASGAMFSCVLLGTALVTAGAAVAAGAAVEVGAAGKVIPLDAGTKVGRAMTAAGADGDIIEVLLIPA